MVSPFWKYPASTRSHFISINYQDPQQIKKIYQSLGKFQGFRGFLPGTWTKSCQVFYSSRGECVSIFLSIPAHTHACISCHAKDISISCHEKSFIIWPHPAVLALPPATLNSLFPGHHSFVRLLRCISCPHCWTQDSFMTNTLGPPQGNSP